MPLSGESLKVIGLREFQREIRKLDDKGVLDELKDLNVQVAQLVIGTAQSVAGGLGRMEQVAAASLKPARQAARAQVSGGGAGVPFFGGAEFGAGRDQPRIDVGPGPGRGYNQFKAWTGNGSNAGRFLYPAIRQDTAEIVEMYGDALEKLAAKAFPD